MEDDSHRGQDTRQSGAIGDPTIGGMGISDHHEDLPIASGSASSSDVIQPPGKYNYSLKKTRTQFTPKQILHLEERFLENQFPNAREREGIANELDLTTQHIQVWFQNRRAKHRRKSKKKQKMEMSAIEPPEFWPKNLSFDSNLSKGRIVPIDQASTLKKSTAPLSSSEDISLSPASTPSSEQFQTPTGLTSISSPLSTSSTTTTTGDVLVESSQQSSTYQSIASISSPSILAESPVRLYDILKDMPDLSASLLDDPVVISTQSPHIPSSHPTLSIPSPHSNLSHDTYGVHHDNPVHMSLYSTPELVSQSSYMNEPIPSYHQYTPLSHNYLPTSDYHSYSYPPHYPTDVSLPPPPPPSYTLYQPPYPSSFPPNNSPVQTQSTTQEVTPSITESSQYGRRHCY